VSDCVALGLPLPRGVVTMFVTGSSIALSTSRAKSCAGLGSSASSRMCGQFLGAAPVEDPLPARQNDASARSLCSIARI
jgi:hypothetical protein